MKMKLVLIITASPMGKSDPEGLFDFKTYYFKVFFIVDFV